MNFDIRLALLENEYWWGGCNVDGLIMPFYKNCKHKRNLVPNDTYNQATPLLLSNKGRFIWCESGFCFSFEDDSIKLSGHKDKPQLYDGYENLRGSFLAASSRFFPTSKKAPPKDFFDGIQYNTWIELTYYQNQKDILGYARKIKETGMPCKGLLMIDCGWSDYYGKFDFSAEKFPSPKSMVDELHSLGFKVMIWICPFISADSSEYRFARDNGFLVKDKSGNPSIKQWWDGYSAAVDFTNPDAVNWFKGQTQKMMDKYGVDGFKLDAGDAHFYSDNDVIYNQTDCNGQSEAWALFGLNYDYNEYRSCWKCAGQPLVQRLGDKNHSWDNNGISTLVPYQVAQGILGYAYTCPDMIGGGLFTDFIDKSMKLDQELFVRYAQCAALMPMMQFSAAPWRVLDEKHFKLSKEAAYLHMEYAPQILELVEKARLDGEPIVRYLEYVFPNQGLEKINDQFMLGNDILVAPVLTKGTVKRNVVLPEGKWQDHNGSILIGGKTVVVNSPLNVLPIFKKLK